jgi:probable F420-dependent oxidoreductase
VKLDATIRGIELGEVAVWAAGCEKLGFDGIWTTETNHDPYFPLVLAAPATSTIELGTGIALAFPRSPTHLAHAAWDLQTLSAGRFVLGLGSQVRAHVVRRFSSEYERPVSRMREIIAAVRAIWTTWSEGTPLDFRGEFYEHTLMPPAFSPPDPGYGHPRIAIAGVQPLMTELAGEAADMFLAHPLQTRTYIEETILPAIERGLERARRSREEIEVSLALFAVESEAERADVRRRIAFYASTPQYRPVLSAHGWDALGDELHALSRAGKWGEMAACVPDEVVDEVAVVGSSALELSRLALARYRGLVDRVNIHAGEHSSRERLAELATGFSEALRAR